MKIEKQSNVGVSELISISIIFISIMLWFVYKYFYNMMIYFKMKFYFSKMKDTPIIEIKCLSDITNNRIFAKCEYCLPFTSKDRMIKNILLKAKE